MIIIMKWKAFVRGNGKCERDRVCVCVCVCVCVLVGIQSVSIRFVLCSMNLGTNIFVMGLVYGS